MARRVLHEGECRAPDNDGNDVACMTDADCAAGQTCKEGECKN